MALESKSLITNNAASSSGIKSGRGMLRGNGNACAIMASYCFEKTKNSRDVLNAQ
jgi:hypothetical protein